MKKWEMFAGTEGIVAFVPAGESTLGKVGVRDLGNDRFRVRVVPVGPDASTQIAIGLGVGNKGSYWKTPADGEFRYSVVTYSKDDMKTAVILALKAIRVTNQTELNFKAFPWSVDALKKPSKKAAEKKAAPKKPAKKVLVKEPVKKPEPKKAGVKKAPPKKAALKKPAKNKKK